ncbi:MAG: RNA polymerase sigma factor [Thermoflexibacteraceae bacterium]|jgi:RNA polymerase sigma factor (sigma-70 family)
MPIHNEHYNETQLIEECSKGNRKAQRQLYEQFYRQMYVVALRYSRTTFDAEDILQESFVKVFQNIESLNAESSLVFWIRKIVVNTAIKFNRRKLDQAGVMNDIDDMHSDHEPVVEATLSHLNFKQLLSFIQQLAPRYQMVFNLYAIEGYQHAEIAAMLDISENTSKSQYARARAVLQEMIAKEEAMLYEREKTQYGI